MSTKKYRKAIKTNNETVPLPPVYRGEPITDFSKPTPATLIEIAFPAHGISRLPPYSQIPSEYKRDGPSAVSFVNDLFYHGFQGAHTCVPRDGIVAGEALSHIAAIVGSYEPKHEHKIAGAAYLVALWLESFTGSTKPGTAVAFTFDTPPPLSHA